MTRIRMFALIAAAFASPAISIEPVWAQSRTEVIAQTGQAAPDGNGTFSSLGGPLLNDSGQAAFRAVLNGTSGGGSDDTGNFLGNVGSITQIVREGQSAPDANGTFSFLNDPVLNNAGQAAFRANLLGTSGGASDNEGIFRGSGGSITQIAREGQSAPGNGTFFFFGLPKLNDSGQAAFFANLTGTSGGTNDNEGIFRGSGGSITQIAREGQSAPDANGTFLNFSDPVLNNAGQAAFEATLTGTSGGGSDNKGIFRGSGGSITQIAREGQSAPDANGTFSSFSTFGSQVLNNAGQAAFWADLIGTSGGASDNSGIFRGSGGSITQIVREGQSAPDANGIFSSFNSLVLNDSGHVAFRADLTGTSGGSSDDGGIFRGSGGSITQIAREGQSAPNANGTFFFFGLPKLNDSGQAAFFANLTGTSGGTNDNEGIFTSDGIDFFQVVRKGDSLGGGIINVVNEMSLNEHGQIAYKTTLSNGNQVIGRWTPELHWRNPSSSTWDSTGRWTLGLKPAFVHDVFIDPAASLTVTGPASDTTVRSLQVGGGAGLATLSLRNGASLTATDGFSVASKGTLTGDGTIVGDVSNVGTVIANNITVTGTLTNAGVMRGTGIIDANIVNSISGKVRAIGGDQLRLSGASLVNFGLVEINASELQIDGQLNNEYSTGLVSIRNGTLIADSGIANQGGIAMTQGYSQIFGDITNLGGTVQVSGGAHATFFGDFIQTGVLQVATVGNTSSVAVFLGGFGGSGGFTGGGDVFVLGDLRPGDSPASVLYDGNLFLGNATNTFIELGGLELGDFDQMRVTGDLSLSGDLTVSLINGHTLGAGQQYLIGDIDGMLSGQFNGLGEGSLVGVFSGYQTFISYSAGDGNDIALITAIPEPGTAWLLALIGTMIASRRRRVA